MIRLDTTTRTLEVLLGGAVATTQLSVTVYFTNNFPQSLGTRRISGAPQVSTTNNTTAVTICGAPLRGSFREIDHIVVRNNDTANSTVTVRLNDNGTFYKQAEVILATGEHLYFTKESGWYSVDTSGNIKTTIPNAITFGVFDAKGDLLVASAADAATRLGVGANNTHLVADSAEVLGVRWNANTGTGNSVMASSPTLVTPALGTPASGVLTNCTGTAAGLTAGNVTTNANLTGHVTSVGNAAVLGSFTIAQLSAAISDANISNNNSGDQTITLTGAVTGSGTGSFATTLASAIVAQGNLKTTTGEVSVSATTANIALPGGEYGFYPQVKDTGDVGKKYQIAFNIVTAPYSTNIHIDASDVGDVGFAQQRYVQASPPYDLGDGEIPLFIFVMVNTLGAIEAVWCAPDPVWANNGPTSIRPDFFDAQGRAFQFVKDISPALKARLANRQTRVDALLELTDLPLVPREITQAVKQADMPLIPHPFMANNLAGKTIVLLDPVSALVAKLQALHATGESINALLHEDYLRVGNTPLVRAGPPGVMAVAVNWKTT